MFILDRRGGWQSKEKIDVDVVFGVFVDKYTGQETPTTKGTIHYGKRGAHAVPRFNK